MSTSGSHRSRSPSPHENAYRNRGARRGFRRSSYRDSEVDVQRMRHRREEREGRRGPKVPPVFSEFRSQSSSVGKKAAAAAEFLEMRKAILEEGMPGPDWQFFVKHRGEEWLHKKYHPAWSLRVEEMVRQAVEERLTEFFSQVKSGEIAKRLHVEEEQQESVRGQSAAEEFFGNALLIKEVPESLWSSKIENQFKQCEGFTAVKVSAPVFRRETRNFVRDVRIVFESKDAAAEVLKTLASVEIDSQHFSVVPNTRMHQSDRKALPSILLEERRILRDLDQVLQIIRKLDSQRGLESTFSAMLTGNPLQQLDMALLYLLSVHLFSYYSMKQFSDEESLSEEVGIFYKRSMTQNANYSPDEEDFVNRLDSRFHYFMKKRAFCSREELEDYLSEPFYLLTTVEEDVDKFRCGECSKLFRGSEFVLKHIKNKHSDKLLSQMEDAENYEYLVQFVADPDRPMFPQFIPKGNGAYISRDSAPSERRRTSHHDSYPRDIHRQDHYAPMPEFVPPPPAYISGPPPYPHMYAPPTFMGSIPYVQAPYLAPPYPAGGSHPARMYSAAPSSKQTEHPEPISEPHRKRPTVQYRDFDSHATKTSSLEDDIDYGL